MPSRQTGLRVLGILALLFHTFSALAHEDCERYYAQSTPATKTTTSFKTPLYFNSGNPEKWSDMGSQLGGMKIQLMDHDLREIESSHLDVVVHKASQFYGDRLPEPGAIVLVEDSAFHVEGEDWGIKIKWNVHKIAENTDKYIGRQARWDSLIAYRDGDVVRVYAGSVKGTIVARQCEGPGFCPFFLPENHSETIGAMNYEVSARKLAIRALFEGKPHSTNKPLVEWDGPYQ